MTNQFIQAVCFLLLISFTSPAQSIVGTWKCTGNQLVMADGTKKDMRKTLLKVMPCQADIKYVFTASGEYYSESPKGCGTGDQMGHIPYRYSGNTLTFTIKKDLGVPVIPVYSVVCEGDQLVLSHDYTQAEKSELHTSAKKIVVSYQRI